MGEVINLNRYRKQKQLAERERRANEKRMRFGSKSERAKSSAEQRADARGCDGAHCDERSASAKNGACGCDTTAGTGPSSTRCSRFT